MHSRRPGSIHLADDSGLGPDAARRNHRHPADAGQAGTSALRAQVSAPSGNVDTFARVAQTFLGNTSKTASLAFAVRIQSANAEYFELGCTLELRGPSTGTYREIQPELFQGQLKVDDNARSGGSAFPSGDAGVVGSATFDKWYQFKIHATQITTTGAHVAVDVDSNRYLERDVTFPAAPTALRVKCGIDYADPDGQALVFVDDVTFDTCP